MSETTDNELVPEVDLDALPVVPESQLDLSSAVKLPLSELPALGMAFSDISEAFGSLTTTVTADGGEILFKVTDVAGNILTPEALQRFKDGSGYLGSTKTLDSFAQARLHPVVAPEVSQTVTTVTTFNPANVFLAAALVEIDRRLDAISEMQEKMFAYAKRRDHAQLVGAFKVLNELRENYSFNTDNESYLSNRHHLVSAAWRDAENAIEFQRENLASMLSPIGGIHLGGKVSKRTDEMLEAMRDYQLASYLYCYAKLMDIVLVGNYEPAYLKSVSDKMERYSLEYFDLYGKCADRIEADAKGSLGAKVADGIGSAVGKLGRLVESTPVGEKTRIDEKLLGGSEAMEALAQSGADKNIGTLALAKPGFMRPFIDSVVEMNHLHNDPVALAVSNDSVYVLPLE